MPVLHRARLCKICRWDDYQGYGFSLHATRGKIGHFIGDVDPQSPAFAGGVRDNDFVVEVNGINVLSDPHQQVVDRIKQLPDQVTLLVLDREARKYFEEKNVVVDSYMEALERIDCPASNPHIHSGSMDTKDDTYRSSTRIEIIREPEALQASKAESNHERTIILLHSSTDGSQLRDSTNRDSTREPHANGASFAEPEVRKQSVGPRENGHYSNASTILIETVPQSDRRENLRSTSRETQQSPIESRPPRVNSVGLDERSNSVSRSERSIKSDTLDSPRPLSDVTNGDRLDEDLMAVKMKCATRSRKNRLPASTFAERKKMFDQL